MPRVARHCTQVDFDSKVTSYEELVSLFFKSHSFEMGSGKRQYMSAIFAHNQEQLDIARAFHSRKWEEKKGRVSTVVETATDFYDAELYHQKWQLQRKAPLFKAIQLASGADVLDSPIA